MREDAAFKKGIELGFARAAMPWAVGLVVCMDVTVGFDVKIWRQSKPMRRAQALIDVKSAEGLAIRPQNRALLFRIVR